MDHFVPELRLAFPELLDAPDHDRAPLGKHGRRVHEGVERLGTQVGGITAIEVEIAGGKLHSPLHNGPDSLVLEDILVTVQEINGVWSALLEATKERIEGERRHTGRKLPPARARRKVEKPLAARGGGGGGGCGRAARGRGGGGGG